MFGIIKPLPKLSLMYKCRDCGHKFKPLLIFLPKKCPLCGGKSVKVSAGFVEEEPGLIVH